MVAEFVMLKKFLEVLKAILDIQCLKNHMVGWKGCQIEQTYFMTLTANEKEPNGAQNTETSNTRIETVSMCWHPISAVYIKYLTRHSLALNEAESSASVFQKY